MKALKLNSESARANLVVRMFEMESEIKTVPQDSKLKSKALECFYAALERVDNEESPSDE